MLFKIVTTGRGSLGLFVLVALYRCLHRRGIDDLAAACNVAMFLQLLLDLLEH